MDKSYSFDPPRRAGVFFHLTLLLLLLAVTVWCLSQATQATLGPVFIVFLLSTVLFSLPVPVLIYRLYSLLQAGYLIERDGVGLRWGLRLEEIPITKVLWVQLAEGVQPPVKAPWLRWPGAVLGRRRHPDLGEVEFMAAEVRRFILIGTPERVYAVTPKDRSAFLQAYKEHTELGSLTPVEARSVYPTFLLVELWESRPARAFLLAGLVLSLVLLVWVGLAVPTRETISLGFSPSGAPLEPVPAVQLFLLPVLNLFFFLANFLLSLYFYRWSERHSLAYVLWGSGALTGILFLAAVFMILSNSA